MLYFDTHIHLHDFEDESFITQLESAQIKKCICISAKQSDWEKVSNLYEKYSDLIIPAFGLHPWYADEKTSDWAEKLEMYLQKYPTSLVGECGFDRLKNVAYDIQKDVFLRQTALANKYKKGLIIHAVKADCWLEDMWEKLPQKFVFHSFNSGIELLKKVQKYGGYVALNKKVLKNKNAKNIILTIQNDKMLTETDAPYQSQIHDLSVLVESLACIKNESVANLAKSIYLNAREFVKNG